MSAGERADNLFEHRGLVDFLSKRHVLLLELLLVSLAVLNIGRRDVPANDLSLVVLERVVPNQKPAIGSVAATQAHFQLVRGAASQRRVDICLDPVGVVRMHLSPMASLTPLVEADAVVGERHAVRVQPLALGSYDKDDLWREVQAPAGAHSHSSAVPS